MKENIYRNEKVRGEEGQTQAQRKELADRERSFFNPTDPGILYSAEHL